MCYMEHPFADGAKLRILNAKYTTPDNPRDVSDLQPLIGMLKNRSKTCSCCHSLCSVIPDCSDV